MLKQLMEFRRMLDEVMVQSFGRRIVLYGYGRSGRFIQWYAQYYYGLTADYIITEDWSSAIPYEFPLFRNTVLDFGYKDIKDALVWLAVPENGEAAAFLEAHGYIKNETYFDFYEIVYGQDLFSRQDESATVFTKKKSGYRDIQLMEWLEYKYDCNFLTKIESKDFTGEKLGHAPYQITAQKEIFPILDRCHINFAGEEEAIFDFGCGKGGAIITFLDYGFKKVGGVEYEKNIFRVLQDNMNKLGLEEHTELIEGDAASMTEELDAYNWFYFFEPFTENIYEKVIRNIMDSISRKNRKIHMIVLNPHVHAMIKRYGFILVNQVEIATRQRVADVFTNRI